MINRPTKNLVSTTGRFLIVLIIIPILLFSLSNLVYAADYPKLQNRSLNIVDVSPSTVTNYTISFAYPAATTIGSIRFLMCTDGNIDEPCVSPGGDMSTATLSSQSGITGFSINSQSANEILLTRAPAVAGTTQSTYQFAGITNPATTQSALYIRIMTYPTGDGTGALNHASSVVSAITEPIVITTEVPPILFFCAALSVDVWCQNPVGNQINYGTLSPATGNAATSQFGVATNAQGGYVVTINGNTMTSGNKTITATTLPSAFTTGIEQFGLNLRANTNPAIGSDPFGMGISTADPDYNVPDSFKYIDGDVIASAITGTMFDTFTVTYIVNVPATQPAGVYSTTIAYICTAAF